MVYKLGMSVINIRSQRLAEAIEIKGGLAELAKSLGVSNQYLYALSAGRRNVGHKTARKIEKAVGWDEGYMDSKPMEASAELESLLTTMPEHLVVEALQEVIESLSDEGAALVASAILSRAAARR